MQSGQEVRREAKTNLNAPLQLIVGVRKAFLDKQRRLIEPFQIGEIPTFIAHIQRGLDELAVSENRLLVFSGGDTKQSRTTLSEATSYRNLVIANEFFGHPAALASRILTEDRATDSFQNVIFPLVTFALHNGVPHEVEESENQCTKEWRGVPNHLTVVGHEFKRRRFEELHLPALRWPKHPSHFRYVGADPPMSTEKRSEVLEGEMQRGYGAWERDLYGTREALASKRLARGWSVRKQMQLQAIVSTAWQHSAFKDNMIALLCWDGGGSGRVVYPEKLPWDDLDN